MLPVSPGSNPGNPKVKVMEAKKKRILEFIKKNKICVISTVNSKGVPEAAAMEFGETDEFELIFDAFSNSRKIANIKRNQNVAVVIGWDENITVQYEGKARMLKESELGKYKRAYFAKNPEAKRWEKREGIVYFKVQPRWIRYSDLTHHPWYLLEINKF